MIDSNHIFETRGQYFRTSEMVLATALLALLLSILVAAYNWKVNKGSIFLSIILILCSIYILHQYFITEGGSAFWLAIFYNNMASTWFLAGPLMLWYTRSLIKDKVIFYKSDLLHLIPFIIHFAGVVPYILTSFDHKLMVAKQLLEDTSNVGVIQANWLVPLKFSVMARTTLHVTYAAFCIFKFTLYLKQTGDGNSAWKIQQKHVKGWYYIFMIFMFLLGANNLVIGIDYVFFGAPPVRIYDYAVILTNSVIVACLPSFLLVFPNVLYGIPKKPKKYELKVLPDDSNKPVIKPVIKKEPSETVNSNTIYFNDLSKKIKEAIAEEKLYLDPDLNLNKLARIISVPRHHLYYCLNSVLGISFSALKNSYRIEHAKKLLLESDLSKFTIDSIGLKSGFTSRSNFYSTFKEVTGITPTEFLANNNKSEQVA